VLPLPPTRFNFVRCHLFLESTNAQHCPLLSRSSVPGEDTGTATLRCRAGSQRAYQQRTEELFCGLGSRGSGFFYLLRCYPAINPPFHNLQHHRKLQVYNPAKNSLPGSNTRSTNRPARTGCSRSAYKPLYLEAGFTRRMDDPALTCVGIRLLQQLRARVHIGKSSNSKAVRGMQLGLKEVTAVFPNIHQLQ